MAIQGRLHTVRPVALEQRRVFCENCREYTVLESKHFGRAIQMEVGALMVGRICNYHQTRNVRRGEEKGRFEFGGSTVILLLQKNAVRPEPCCWRTRQEAGRPRCAAAKRLERDFLQRMSARITE